MKVLTDFTRTSENPSHHHHRHDRYHHHPYNKDLQRSSILAATTSGCCALNDYDDDDYDDDDINDNDAKDNAKDYESETELQYESTIQEIALGRVPFSWWKLGALTVALCGIQVGSSKTEARWWRWWW